MQTYAKQPTAKDGCSRQLEPPANKAWVQVCRFGRTSCAKCLDTWLPCFSRRKCTLLNDHQRESETATGRQGGTQAPFQKYPTMIVQPKNSIQEEGKGRNRNSLWKDKQKAARRNWHDGQVDYNTQPSRVDNNYTAKISSVLRLEAFGRDAQLMLVQAIKSKKKNKTWPEWLKLEKKTRKRWQTTKFFGRVQDQKTKSRFETICPLRSLLAKNE